MRCPHDGSILTTTWRSNRAGSRSACFADRADDERPLGYSVGEHAILDWAKLATAEVLSRVGIGHQPVILDAEGNVVAGEPEAVDVNARAGALRESRRRLVRVYTNGDISDAEYDRDLADIDRRLDLLANEQRSVNAWHLPFSWECPDGVSENAWKADLNVRLRDVLHSIHLNAELRPVAGVWRRRPLARDGSGVFMLDEQTCEEVGEFDPRAHAVEGGWMLPARPRKA